MNYLTEIENEKVFVIVSGALGKYVVPLISEMPQLAVIYVFFQHEAKHRQWTEEWKKVKSVFT